MQRALQFFCALAVILPLVAGHVLPEEASGTSITVVPQDTNTIQLLQTREQRRDIPELSKAFRKYDLIKFNPEFALSEIHRTGKLRLTTSKRVFDLQLFPHDLRSADYRSQVIGADGTPRKLPEIAPNTYRGLVRDMPGAEVRMTVTDSRLEGAIITTSNHYFIQPARSFSKAAATDEFVFYDGQDVTQNPGTCGVILPAQIAAEQDRAKRSIDTATVTSPSSLKIVRLATDADAEYVAALGGPTQANNQILSIMNLVDGIYQVELGLTFQVVFQNSWIDPATDPYTATDSAGIVNEFSTYWNANFRNMPRSLAHLWTAKDLGGLLGAANLGVACLQPQMAYGFSRGFPGLPATPTAGSVALTAHEIGHNFSAVHIDVPTSELPADIVAACSGSVMNSFGGFPSFCTFSRSQIMGFTNTHGSCLLDAGTSPPNYPPCVDVPIDPDVVVSGSLAETDCRSPSRGILYFADQYSFNGQAGQRLHITMNTADPGLSYLYLMGPDGFVIAHDANNVGSNSSRIPASGSIALPDTGRYVIEATSVNPHQTGNYTVSVNLDGCVLSVNPTSQHFPAGGGAGTINVTATGSGCGPSYEFTVAPIMTPWLTTQSSNGTGSQTLGFNVQANPNVAGRRAFLLVGSAFGSRRGGLSIPITQSGTGPDCALTPINFGQTINGSLTISDCRSPIKGTEFSFADHYVFTAAAGQEVSITASPTFGNSFLALSGPTGRVILTDVDGGGPAKARIPGGTGMLKLGLAGQYVIEVTSASGGATGPYSLTLLTTAAPVLFTEENSDSAIALESVNLLRDPFPLTDSFFSLDRQTRVTLFGMNLGLLPGENQTAVTAVAEDDLLNSYPLTVEFVGEVPGFNWISQVVIKLPSNLPLGQDVRVSTMLRGKTSNKVRFRVR